jgi:hypothetical protein
MNLGIKRGVIVTRQIWLYTASLAQAGIWHAKQENR